MTDTMWVLTVFLKDIMLYIFIWIVTILVKTDQSVASVMC